MTLNEFVAEIKSSLKSYDNAGYLDEISIRRWVTDELKRFGTNIMTHFEKTFEVKNSTVKLPNNFWGIRIALKVKPKGYKIVKGEKDALLDSFIWTEQITRTAYWDDWTDVFVTEAENTISERIYLNRGELIVDLYYVQPLLLTVHEGFDRQFFKKDSFNIHPDISKSSLHDIILNSKTIYTNFPNGHIYLQYYGLNEDENGEVVIPDTSNGHLIKYLEYYVKYRIMEDIMVNTPDQSVINALNLYNQQKDDTFTLAMTEAKFSTISDHTYQKIRNNNRRDMMRFEHMLPQN